MSLIRKNKVILGLGGLALAVYLTKKYFAGGVCKSQAKLHGKTVIVTGSNTGIGKETAKNLVQRGARVILACRNLERANKAAEDIRKSTNQGTICVMKLDLASFESVRQFAKEFLDSNESLDILINNAGLFLDFDSEKFLTQDGNELTIQSNHLGHFLLTNLLMEKLEETPGSRIVNVSSIGHKESKYEKFDVDDLNFEKNDNIYNGYAAYVNSKLANILFTRELAKRLKNTTAYCLHPGVIETEITRNFNRVYQIASGTVMWPIKKIFMKNCWEGAQTTIFCAIDETLDGITGRYYADCQESKLLNPKAENDELAKKLWEKSAEIVQI